MKAAFKIRKFITCGFAAGEVRGADEFPPGTDFARLVEDGAIRPMPGVEVHGGDPKLIDLLDQVEDLTEKLNKAKDEFSRSANQSAETVKRKEAELADLKQQLARASLDVVSAKEDLAKRPAAPEGFEAAAAAKDAEIARLQTALAGAEAAAAAKDAEIARLQMALAGAEAAAKDLYAADAKAKDDALNDVLAQLKAKEAELAEKDKAIAGLREDLAKKKKG